MNPRCRAMTVCLTAIALACKASTPTIDEGRVLSYGSPEDGGFSATRLAGAVDTIRRAVDDGRITGVQLLVARHGKVVVHEAMGVRDIEQRLSMETNTLLRMASVTKTVVATGIHMLADDGLLRITDPVSQHLSGFSDGWSAGLTIGDLLRHTSGFPYTFDNYVGEITMEADEFPDAPSLRAEAIKIGREGPEVEPGTRCQYTNWAFTVLGGVLESVSGKKLDAFLQDRLYTPLGMNETSHALYGVDSARVSLNYQWNGEGWDVLEPEAPPFARSTGGLVTTAWDFAKFAQLWLDRGRYGDSQLLTAETAAAATQLQVECSHLYVGPELLGELGFRPMWYYVRDNRARGFDLGYGYGWAVARDNSFSHGGFRGTFVLIDPTSDMFILLFAQSRVGGTPGQEFIEAVYNALTE